MTQKHSITDYDNDVKLLNKFLDHVPEWSIGAIGTLLAIAFTVKIMGIDYTDPAAKYTEAHTLILEQQAESIKHFNTATEEMKNIMTLEKKDRDTMFEELSSIIDRQDNTIVAIMERLNTHEERIFILEGDT